MPTMANATRDDSAGREPKVARLIDSYDMAIGEELERAWTGEGGQRRSLRELAEHFNRELLAHVLEEAGVRTVDGELANIHRLLTDEDVTAADSARIRRRLEREGVDVDAYLRDTVSYQAIRTYLTGYRGVDYEAPDDGGLEGALGTVERLQGRVASVTGDKLEQHCSDADALRVLVDTTVICEDCGRQDQVAAVLERGGCACAVGED